MTTPTEQPDAIRLAKGLRDGTLLLSERDEAAEWLERLHAAREADREAMRMALEALKEAKFVLDFATAAMIVPADADGPVAQIPAAIKALEQRVGES